MQIPLISKFNKPAYSAFIKSYAPKLIALITILIFIGILVKFMSLTYPRVGHDYALIIPQMLDTAIHFRANGLSIQWYSPTFGGGLPAYGNPNNSQFSMLVDLGFFLEPWSAVIISTIFFVLVGFLGGIFFFQHTLNLHWTTSILGAIFFSANGFILERMAAGHIGYQTLPLLSIVLILLFDQCLPSQISALIFSLLIALLIHQAGFFIVLVFGLSLLMIIPILYLYRPSLLVWKRVLTVILWGGAVAVLISASKLYSIYSFMRFFPRQLADEYSTSLVMGLFSILLQLLGPMTLVPLMALAHLDYNNLNDIMIFTSGAQYGYWEFDMAISPVVFGLLLIAAIKFFHTPRIYLKKLQREHKWIAAILLIFFTILNLEFTLAKGLIYPLIRTLPILSSLHVNPRFAVAFLFPLILTASVTFDGLARQWSEKKKTVSLLLADILTLGSLSAYFFFSIYQPFPLYDVTESQKIFKAIQQGETFNIQSVGYTDGNTGAISDQTSNINVYEPIFGYRGENFHPEVTSGSIWTITNGYYNMSDPTGYIYPEANASRPFARIPVSDKSKLETFARHQQPDWKIPAAQQFFNWLSIFTFIAATSIVIGFFAVKIWHGSGKARSRLTL